MFTGLGNSSSAANASSTSSSNQNQPPQQQQGTGSGLFGSSNASNSSFGGFGGFGSTSGSNPSTFSFGSSAPSQMTSFSFGATGTQPSTGFGQQSTVPFGSTTPKPAGSSLFGNQPTTFGATSNQPTTFGMASNQPTSFGTTPGQPTSFGATSGQPTAFGSMASTQSSPFGISSGQSTPFGSQTNAFQSQSTSTQPSSFGGGLFGSSSFKPATTSFGSSVQAATSTFSNPSTTPFGSTASSLGTPSNAFGMQSSSIFPSQQIAGSSLFGTTPAISAVGAATSGTGNPPFSQTSDLETDKTVYLQSISAMPSYKTKSFEELRWEDYQRGNKFAGFPSSTTATTAGASSFGSTFITGTSTGFGSTGFGMTPSSGFGAPSSTTGFGSQPSLNFGSATASSIPSQTTSSFAAPSGTGLFGSNITTPTTNIFGNQPATSFGTQPATTPFGSTQQTTTPFGTSQSASGTGMFGAQQSSAGNLFGAQSNTTPTSGLFGSQQSATTPFSFTSGSGFGSTQGTGFGSTGLFSTPSSSSTATAPPTSTTSFFSQPASTIPQSQGATGFFGSSSTMPSSTTSSLFNSNMNTPAPLQSFTTPASSANQFASSFKTPTFSSFTTPQQPLSNISTSTPQTFGSFSTPQLSHSSYSTSQPAIDANPYGPSSFFPSLSTASIAPSSSFLTSSASSQQALQTPVRRTPLRLPKSYVKFKPVSSTSPSFSTSDSAQTKSVLSDYLKSGGESIKKLVIEFNTSSSKQEESNVKFLEREVPQESSISSTVKSASEFKDYGNEAVSLDSEQLAPQGHYFSNPPISQLKKLSPKSLESVENFKVGRKGIGLVEFLVPVNLSTIPLNRIFGGIVQFSAKQISVYPDSVTDIEHADPGSGLNVPARVTLYGCWPVDAETKSPICQSIPEETLKKHLRKLALVEDCDFVDFEPSSGAWVFRVNHFSSYSCECESQKIKVKQKSHLIRSKTMLADAGLFWLKSTRNCFLPQSKYEKLLFAFNSEISSSDFILHTNAPSNARAQFSNTSFSHIFEMLPISNNKLHYQIQIRHFLLTEIGNLSLDSVQTHLCSILVSTAPLQLSDIFSQSAAALHHLLQSRRCPPPSDQDIILQFCDWIFSDAFSQSPYTLHPSAAHFWIQAMDRCTDTVNMQQQFNSDMVLRFQVNKFANVWQVE